MGRCPVKIPFLRFKRAKSKEREEQRNQALRALQVDVWESIWLDSHCFYLVRVRGAIG